MMCYYVGQWAGTVLYRYIFTLSDLVLIILYVKVKMDPKKEGRKICGVSRVYLHVNTIGYILLSKSIHQVLYYIYIIIAPLD